MDFLICTLVASIYPIVLYSEILNRKPHFSNSNISMGFCLEIGANYQAFRY